MDSPLKTFNTGPIKAVGYADDVILTGFGVDLKTIVEKVQRGIDKTIEWGREKGLTFNPNKTQAVVFESARKVTAIVPRLHMETKL